MCSLYAACLSRLGLSEADAADLHIVSPAIVAGWACGALEPPPTAWDDLRDYNAQVAEWQELIRQEWDTDGEPLEVPIRYFDGAAMMGAAEFVLTAPVYVLPNWRASTTT
jgi:hypothetical protein